MVRQVAAVLATVGAALLIPPSRAGEGPFFITYTHQMEEPRNLELMTKNVTGKPGDGKRFVGTVAEFEYGVTGGWTTELYLDGQATSRENALFTGYRWENRFRLIPRELWINPVLYMEFEDINGPTRPCSKWLATTGRPISQRQLPKRTARKNGNSRPS